MLTTLATFAATSRSLGSAPRVAFNEDMRDAVNKVRSLRHSVVKAFNIFKVISNVLEILEFST